jgi:7,8-dihydroneopterin aldolase/epimerase/oxygenase
MPKPQGTQILTLTGLRFDANLGILESEMTAPQPIQVDAELSLGSQPLLPHDDDINHVLDYRKVRQIIINECTATHVNLLESSPTACCSCPVCWACGSRLPSLKFLTTAKSPFA